MSRNNLITLLLIIASLLLAVALFIAGAIWRGRTTARSAAMDSKESVVPGTLAAADRGAWRKHQAPWWWVGIPEKTTEFL